MNKKLIIYIVLSILIIAFGIFAILFKNQDKENKNTIEIPQNSVGDTEPKNDNEDIIKYALQTHEYFEHEPIIASYIIDSESELLKFYDIYSDKIDIDTEVLKENTIFVQVEGVNSGSIEMKLTSVTFDNNRVNFIIDENCPNGVTDDMATWYLVAVIPNEKLENLDLSGWSKPSEVVEENEDNQEELSREDKKILLKNSYSNSAWGYVFNGKVLFNDGTIYSWNVRENFPGVSDYDVNTADGLKEFILDKGTKEVTKVSTKELEEIEKEISELEDKIETKEAAVDAGSHTISAWKTNGEQIKLKISGDLEGKNNTDHAKALIKIAEKYLK